MLPLLFPDNLGIVLVVMPLKQIEQQQEKTVNRIPGGRGIVLDADTNSKGVRRKIALGEFTHGI